MSAPAKTYYKNNANVMQTSKITSNLIEYFTASAVHIHTCANVVKRYKQCKKHFANYSL